MIYLIGESFHLYVILHVYDKGLALIADGGNKYIKDEASRRVIQDLLVITMFTIFHAGRPRRWSRMSGLTSCERGGCAHRAYRCPRKG